MLVPTELQSGTLLKDRFTIKRAVKESTSGNLLMVRDATASGAARCVKVLPEADSDAMQDLALFEQLDHPGLARIVSIFSENGQTYVVREWVEGLSLGAVKGMHVGKMPQLQVVQWGMKLCDVLGYLHNRPQPLVCGVLEPSHLIVTPTEDLKLIQIGWAPYLDSRAPRPQAHEDYVALAHLLLKLLDVTEDRMGAADWKDSPILRQIISRLLDMEVQPTFSSFAEVHAALEDVIKSVNAARLEADRAAIQAEVGGTAAGHPVQAPGKINSQFLDLPKWNMPPAVERAVAALLSQSPLYLGIEALGVVVAVVVFWLVANPGVDYHKHGPVAFVCSSEGTVSVLDGRSHGVVDRKSFPNSFFRDARATSNVPYLFLADTKTDRVTVLDPQTDEVKYLISVNSRPTKLFISPDEKRMWVVHSASRSLSVVSLEEYQTVRLDSVPQPATAVAVSADNRTTYVSSQDGSAIYVLSADTGRQLNNWNVSSPPGAMAVSPDGNQLWVCCPTTNALKIYDVSDHTVGTLPQVASIDNLGGTNPIAIRFSPDGVNAWVLCEDSASIAVIGVTDHTVLKNVATGGKDAVNWGGAANSNTVWVANSGSGSAGVVDLLNGSSRTVPTGPDPVAVEVVP
ncbi:MAG: beta-propeller fold lactonase family protein [Candidatus Xenobia bacterium]